MLIELSFCCLFIYILYFGVFLVNVIKVLYYIYIYIHEFVCVCVLLSGEVCGVKGGFVSHDCIGMTLD